MLKWKSGLKQNLNVYTYVAMRSLVMSLFSRNLLVNYIRYLQCLNLVNNYLHEYSIYTVPGF